MTDEFLDNALKQAQQDNEALRAEIEALRVLVAELEAKLASISPINE